MITNERQYRITKAQTEKFRAAIAGFDIKAAIEKTQSKVLARAELAALRSEYEALSLQLHEYETLKSGSVEILKAPTLTELPRILIRARIAKGLSQRQLAEAMGLREQQIQRYEAEEYASANLQRLGEVANVLGLNISEVAEFGIESQIPLDMDEDDLSWDQFPIREMYRRNWFEGFSGSLSEAVDNADELVRRFVTDSIDAPIQAMARQRVRLGGTVNRYALLAWQCRIVGLAKKDRKKVANRFRQRALTNVWFNELTHMSSEKDGPQRAIEYLQNSGIRLVVEPHLPQTHLDGAAFLLGDGPVIGMTVRYDRIDNFWFVLFHELIHIKKHLNKGKIESIFDNLDTVADDMEKEADECAGEALVPEKKWEIALARYVRTKESIEDFAGELGIHPAIVAGKIRREAENYMILTDMVGQGEIRKLFPSIDFSY
ncbi:MAG: helix-turn-helix domain-containing protein [Planctomycetota bacterium]|jgi:HTH-type transcriptional regulator/antitoxin HigA